MDILPEIDAAVDSLPETQQKGSSRHLAERFKVEEEPKRRLPHVAPRGNLITQQNIDDALDAGQSSIGVVNIAMQSEVVSCDRS